MERFGDTARDPVQVLLTGGASAVLRGMRESTLDIDLVFVPDTGDCYRALVIVRDALGLNVELASADHFVPRLPGADDRCEFIATVGATTFRHADPYGLALAKLERGHAQDAVDVNGLVSGGLVDPVRLSALLSSVESEFMRYPTVDVVALRQRVEELASRES